MAYTSIGPHAEGAYGKCRADFFPALPPPFCPLLHVPQRSQVKGWNMKSGLSLGTVPGLNIDLPPQTILDIEVVEETTVRHFTLEIPEWLEIEKVLVSWTRLAWGLTLKLSLN